METHGELAFATLLEADARWAKDLDARDRGSHHQAR